MHTGSQQLVLSRSPPACRCLPQHFLALASVANVGKAIALAAFVATSPAFQQALCYGGNLADLTAKNQVRAGPTRSGLHTAVWQWQWQHCSKRPVAGSRAQPIMTAALLYQATRSAS
jgi:hypothetical protein